MSDLQALCAERLAAANINPASLLATDYLNHFNEVVMLIEMVTDMPSMASDVLEWEPRTYCEHFAQSVFAEKDLAIAAYEQAPPIARSRLEGVVDELNNKIAETQIVLAGTDASEPLDPAIRERIMTMIADEVRPAIDQASAIINAPLHADWLAPERQDEATVRAQDAVDQFFG